MSEAIIPKEHFASYQRWKLQALDDGKSTGSVVLPTAGQIENIHQQAHMEGYQAGYAEGMQQTADAAKRLAGMLDALDKELQRVDQQIVQDLLDLSLEIAKQILHQSLNVKPELLLNVVQEAISALPHFNQHAYLTLHPADAELVREHMGEQLAHTGWKIFEDAQLERGGCRVETANSQIDATLPARWQRVVHSIGKDNQWLES